MISTSNLKAITADLEDARMLRALFLRVAQELPAHADFARVHADTLDMQIRRREARRGDPAQPCQLLVGEDLWSEVEVRLGTRTRSLAQEVEHLRGLLRQVWGAVPGREVAGLGDAIEQALAIQQPKSDT
jgi:hypothetical protein